MFDLSIVAPSAVLRLPQRRLALPLGLALCAGAAAAQSAPQYPGLQVVAGQINHAGVLADLDGDGRLDHASADYDGEAVVSWGLGNGSFASPISFPAGPNPVDLAVLDVDGDADLDLVVACAVQSTGQSEIAVLRNDGSGGFGAPESTPVGGYGGPLYVADVDLDGDADLLVHTGRTVHLLPGDGTGSFGPSVEALAVAPGPRLVITDVDGDGDPDVVGASVALTVHRNDGAGTFGPAETTALPYPPYTLHGADVDGDGDLDLLASTLVLSPPIETKLGVIRADGTGAFIPEALQSVGITEGVDDVEGADVDGDGALDLVVSVKVDGTSGGAKEPALAVLYGDGSGAFAGVVHPFLTAGTLSDHSLFGLSLGDLDGDGALDAVVVGHESLVVFPGDGAGDFRTSTPALDAPDPHRAATGDLDGDGRPDVAIACAGPKVITALGDGDGGFGPSAAHDVGQPARALAMLDWDGDLDVDVVAVGAQGRVELLSGDGSGGAAFAAVVELGVTVLDVACGDLDGDGAQDLLVVHHEGGERVSAAPGGFAAPVHVDLCQGGPCVYKPVSAAVGDLDVDGFLDLAVAKAAPPFQPPQLDTFLGQGAGTLALTTSMATSQASKLHLGDVDEDGLPDLVIEGNPTKVLKGDGAGGFAPIGSYLQSPLAFLWTGLALADADGDGHVDLVWAGGDVRLGQGNGQFGLARTYSWPHWDPTGQLVPPLVVDVDVDGRADVVTLDQQHDRVAVTLALGGCKGEIASVGFSCAGSGGFPPELAVTGCASPGGAIRTSVTGGLGGAPGIVLLALGEVALPLPNGCELYAAPIVGTLPFALSGSAPGAGAYELETVLPPATPGAVVVLQALVLDPGAPASFTSTNAVRLVLD